MYLLYLPLAKYQRWTKEEPRNYQRTPKYKKCCLLRLPFLSPLLYLASFHRETTERTPREQRQNSPWLKVRFLKIELKKLSPFLKRLTHFLKQLTYLFLNKNHPITLNTFKTSKTFSTQNLHIRKFCCTFATDSYAGGSMSCEKRFAMVLSWGRFRTYLNSVYWRFVLTNRNLATFKNTVRSK